MNLNEKSIPELVKIFNQHSPKPVKTFRTKEQALKRVRAVVPKGERPSRFNLPRREDAYEPREGTKRYRVLQMLRRKNGASLEEVMKEIPDWDRRTAYEGVRLINIHCGIGLSQDEKGRIRADAA